MTIEPERAATIGSGADASGSTDGEGEALASIGAASIGMPDTVAAPEPPGTVAQRLEAILLIADEPLSAVSLATAVSAPVRAVRQALAGLVRDYDGEDGGPVRGFELREVGGGWRLYVRTSFDEVVAEHIGAQAPARLSQAALETLAIIAYKQPVSRSQVASIRAVNVDSVVRTLLARGLVTEAAQDPETGAMLYGTTDALLERLGINAIDELPPISPLLADGDASFDELVP